MINALLRRKIFEPLYCLKNNSPQLSYYKQLEQTQFLSKDELLGIQWRRLKKIYNFLWKSNDFYRSRFLANGLSPDSLRSPTDIEKLPILTKQYIRANSTTISNKMSSKMISDGFSRDGLLNFKTGGSTGKALDIFMSETCSELRNACTRRHDRWTGWKPGEPVGAVWGNPKLPQTRKEKLRHNFLQPYIYLDTMAVNALAVDQFAENWRKFQPTLLYGHAHSLFILAQYLLEMGCEDIKPKGILSTSMMLLPHERELIEKVFTCRVTDRYGCEEVSLIGSECEKHQGMHLNIEHLVVEFIKDNGLPAQPGESGDIVVTDLMNYAMPFIRYKVEDVGIPTDNQCSCGRGSPLMAGVIGRVSDFLMAKNGNKIAGISLIENTLTKMEGIDQMQIIQNCLDDMVVKVVPGRAFNDQVRHALLNYFAGIFPGTSISIDTVTEIQPEPSGKYRFSICRIPEQR